MVLSPPLAEDHIAGLEIFPGLSVQTRGISVNIKYFPRVCLQKGFLLPFVVQLNLVKSITNHRKIQKLQSNFVVLSVTITTTFSKEVYTFELQFLLEK
jgi:hypothetical protein